MVPHKQGGDGKVVGSEMCERTKNPTGGSMKVCIVGEEKDHIIEWEAAGNIMVGISWVGKQ